MLTAEEPRAGASNFLRSACQHSLSRFTREAWHAVEGGRYRHNWHIDAVCAHLEAVTFGHIKRLLIIIPPQASKSIICGTFWPAWEWTFNPEVRWLFASNSEELALEESMRCRRLIDSDWYRQTFGITWELREDQDTKGHYQNTYGGARRALGFGANFTGKKGKRLVIDDANDAEKVHSEAERKRVNRKFDNSISDRHLDLNNDPTVVIGQRTHYNDLIGHLRAQGGWQELHIREEFLPDTSGRASQFPVPFYFGDRLFTGDPRTRKGALLRPDDFNPARVQESRRKNLMGYQAKHQGDPRSAEGYRFKAEWFRHHWWQFAPDNQHIELHRDGERYLVHPYGVLHFKERFGIVDPSASKKTTADFMVISTFIITERFDLVWFGCFRKRAEIPEQPAILEAEYRRMRMQWVGVEAVFGNRALHQHAYKSRMVVRGLDPAGRKKLEHAAPALILCESRRVFLPNQEAANRSGFPLMEVMDELTSFTGDEEQDEHDDITDTLSYGVDHFNDVDTGGGVGSAPLPLGTPPAGGWQHPPSHRPPAAPPLIPTSPGTGPFGNAFGGSRPRGPFG